MSQTIVKSDVENLDLTLNEMDLSEIEDKICSKIKILLQVKKDQPIKPLSSGVGSEKTDDWMYFARCSLCKYEGLLRIDFPGCNGCRRELGHTESTQLYEDCQQILKLGGPKNG